jgi:hypothetical protein
MQKGAGISDAPSCEAADFRHQRLCARVLPRRLQALEATGRDTGEAIDQMIVITLARQPFEPSTTSATAVSKSAVSTMRVRRGSWPSSAKIPQNGFPAEIALSQSVNSGCGAKVSGMMPFLFRCPATGKMVQAFCSDDGTEGGGDAYIGVPCLACSRMHIVNPQTGKLLGAHDVAERDGAAQG